MRRNKLLRTCILAAPIAAMLIGAIGCQQEEKKKIGVIPKGLAHSFWQSIHAGAIKAAQETGVEVVWNGPAHETEIPVQLQIMETMINRRLDAIVLAPIDRKALVGVVERAADQNVPVIIIDSSIDTERFVSYVATDNYLAGQLAAQAMGKLLEGKGRVAVVATQPGGASTMQREQGFEDRIREEFPAIQIVDKRFGMSDYAQSRQVAENMLTAHPDLDALFASNESGSVGAAQALKSRKSKVRLVGFDWNEALEADLTSGVISGLVVQDPFKMGYEAVRAAVSKLEGGSIAKINNLAPRLVTLENLNDPEIQAQINPDLKKYLK